jgi:hypothetical protein
MTFLETDLQAIPFCASLNIFFQPVCDANASENLATLDTYPLRVFGIQTGLLW